MTESTCVACGAAFIDDAAFCSRCGSHRAEALAGPLPVVSPRLSGKDFNFTGGALGLFGRSILLGASLFLIAPLPWILCGLYSWFVGKVEGRYGAKLTFHGTPGSVWVLTTLYGLWFVGGIIFNVGLSSTDEASPWAKTGFEIGNNLASIVFGWFFFRWMISNVALSGHRLTMTAGLAKYFGWMLLVMLSIFTIIGWAWALCAMYRWLAGTVRGAPGRFTFTTKGHQFLGRSLLYILFMLPIVTFPWAVRWYLAWLVEQFHFEESHRAGEPGL